VQCASNQRQIGQAFINYSIDFKGALPPVGSSHSTANYVWTELVAPYLGSKDPVAALHNGPHEVGINWITCPSGEKYTNDVHGHYAVNYPVVFAFPANGDIAYLANPASYGGDSRKLVRVPQTTFLLTDGFGNSVYSPTFGPLDYNADQSDTLNDTYSGSDLSQPYNFYNRARPRQHNKGANYLFPDGHVDFRTLRQWLLNESEIWGVKVRP
jgi:prepilin-type processing-associated H-X9-DG protein